VKASARDLTAAAVEALGLAVPLGANQT
jgi:hypothetical protein